MTTQEIIEAVEEATAPELMSKEAALEFINDIIGDLQIEAEALEMEIEWEKLRSRYNKAVEDKEEGFEELGHKWVTGYVKYLSEYYDGKRKK